MMAAGHHDENFHEVPNLVINKTLFEQKVRAFAKLNLNEDKRTTAPDSTSTKDSENTRIEEDQEMDIETSQN